MSVDSSSWVAVVQKLSHHSLFASEPDYLLRSWFIELLIVDTPSVGSFGSPLLSSSARSSFALMNASTFPDTTIARDSERLVFVTRFPSCPLLDFEILCLSLLLTTSSFTSSDFELIIRQQPDRARVAGGKEKGKSQNLNLRLPKECTR